MRAQFTMLKTKYPERAGVSMYGGQPGYGWNGTAFGVQMAAEEDQATITLMHDISMMMVEFWPDP